MLLEAVWLVLLGLGEWRDHMVTVIALTLVTAVLYLIAVWLACRPQAPVPPLWFILIAALAFRLTIWPVFPALSDDIFRYRWEGRLQQAGGNPYQVRPRDEEWRHLRDATYPYVVLPDFRGGYGPALELLEWATVSVIGRVVPEPFAQVFWHKLPAAVADLGCIAALIWVLKLNGLAAGRVLIYAWSPLPINEFWATGHNDAWLVLFLLLALGAARRGWWRGAFAALTVSVCTKFWPALLAPALLRAAGRKAVEAWVGVPILASFAALYWSNVTQNAHFLTGFVSGWRNNDSLYGVLLFLAGDPDRAKPVAFGLVGAMALWAAWRRWPLEQAALIVTVTLLLLSANCHPWYLTWFLPLLALYPVPGLLLWTALMPLSYGVLLRWHTLGEWHGSTPERWLVSGPVLFLLLAGRWYGTRLER